MNPLTRKLHEFIYPLTRWMMKIYNRKRIVCLNQPEKINEGVLYAVNHSCMWDIPVSTEILGKQRLRWMDRLAFILRGTIWVDRKDRISRQKSYIAMKTILKAGGSITIFPEATWNLEPSLPMLPLYWGVVKLGLETNTRIQPIILEYQNQVCYVRFGRILKSSDLQNKAIGIEILRDEMAACKWDIWEKIWKKPVKRAEIQFCEWEKERERILKEYPDYDCEYEQGCVLKS